MEEEIFNYCISKYQEVYQKTKESLEDDAIKNSRNHIVSKTKQKEIESEAQLNAIKVTMLGGRVAYPSYIPLVWSCVYKAHVYRKSGISDPQTVANVISADQSWKASSGHAFESAVKQLGTKAMSGTNIKYILEKDLNALLKNNKIGNSQSDITWLKAQVKGHVFDVYVIAENVSVADPNTREISQKTFCFGCVQCKTSIRDRVSRDFTPSNEAMDRKFWSTGFVLDGTMFRTPKYLNMVNGNVDSEFKKNGWHGMYSLSGFENTDRIYAVDLDFDVVREHTIKAFDIWFNDRMALDINWRADL